MDSACLVYRLFEREDREAQRETQHNTSWHFINKKNEGLMVKRGTFYTCGSCATPHAISLTGPLLGAGENER